MEEAISNTPEQIISNCKPDIGAHQEANDTSNEAVVSHDSAADELVIADDPKTAMQECKQSAEPMSDVTEELGQLMLDHGQSDEGKETSDEETVDPRIEDKLEELNQWTDRINSLEMEFEEENNNYRAFLNECSDKLKTMARKIGQKHIDEARPYFEAKQRARDYQKQCQKTVLAYERACQSLLQAKEEVDITEKKFRNQSSQSTSLEFDQAWQEVLNKATTNVLNAEREKKRSKINHETSMKQFMATEDLIVVLEKRIKPHIKKSRPYFEESERFKSHLAKIKTEIEMLNEKIVASKSCYAVTLKDLESISEEIHERRNSRLIMSLPREPCVGAEITSLAGSHPNISIDYSDIVPELNVTSPRFQLEVRPEKMAVLDQVQPMSSGNVSADSLELARSSSALSDLTTSDVADSAFNNSCDISLESEHNQQPQSANCSRLKIEACSEGRKTSVTSTDKGFEEVALD